MRVLVTGGSGFIGTNLIEDAAQLGWQLLNVDVVPPRNGAHRRYWHQVDVLDLEALKAVHVSFQPTAVVHLAARTDLDERATLEAYRVNTDGTRNVVDAIAETKSVTRAVFASTQLVCRLGYRPTSDDDMCPSTVYGRSKAAGEHIIRSATELDCTWVIARPTSIWGPWFGVPYRGFFDAIRSNVYVHPGRTRVTKQWGFVGNSVFQIRKLLEAPPALVHKRTFYLADYEPTSLHAIADTVQRVSGARPIRTVPRPILRAVALAGDALQATHVMKPPLTSFRLKNMTTDEVQDMAQLEAIVGRLPYTLEDGVGLTVSWMAGQMNRRYASTAQEGG